MEKEALGQNWYLGETLLNGIGQGYIQTTPITTLFNDSTISKWWI